MTFIPSGVIRVSNKLSFDRVQELNYQQSDQPSQGRLFLNKPETKAHTHFA